MYLKVQFLVQVIHSVYVFLVYRTHNISKLLKLILCLSIVFRLAKARQQQQYGDPVHPGAECGDTAGHRPVVLFHLRVPEQPESFTSASSTAAQTGTRPERRDVHAHRLQTKGEIMKFSSWCEHRYEELGSKMFLIFLGLLLCYVLLC